MLKVIAGLIAGLMLGIASTAVAGVADHLWRNGGTTYSCQGINSGVICRDKHSPYLISFTPKYAGVFRGNTPVAGCSRDYDSMDMSCIVDSRVPQG